MCIHSKAAKRVNLEFICPFLKIDEPLFWVVWLGKFKDLAAEFLQIFLVYM